FRSFDSEKEIYLKQLLDTLRYFWVERVSSFSDTFFFLLANKLYNANIWFCRYISVLSTASTLSDGLGTSTFNKSANRIWLIFSLSTTKNPFIISTFCAL